MKAVLLSKAAQADLEDIFDYTYEEYGLDQAVTYVSDFDSSFASLSENPEIGRRRPEIRAGLRSIAKDKHVIFYRLCDDHIRIVRILHGSRDLPQSFV